MTDIVAVTPEVPIEPTAPPVMPETPPVVPPVNYFNTDGSLVDGWQSTLPEGYREEKSLSTVKDAKTLAKMFVDTKRMVGKNTMVRPNENSPLDEWSDYYEAGGRPSAPEEYALAPPAEFPPELAETVFPAERVGKWQQRFFDGGISKKAADQFIAEFANDMLEDHQAHQQAQELQMTELKTGLATKWGAAFAQKEHLGNIAIDEGTMKDVEFKERLLQKFGNDPDFIEYSSNLGSKFSEGKSPDFSAIPTPSDMQEQISKLEQDPLYLNGTQKQRMDITSKIMAIRKQMTKGATIP